MYTMPQFFRVKLLACLIIWSNCFDLMAQNNNPVKLDLGLNNKSNVIKNIAIDSAGYLWFNTNVAIHRFNGLVSTTMDNYFKSLDTSEIVNIEASSHGVWAADKHNLVYLNVLNWEENRIYCVEPDQIINYFTYVPHLKTLILTVNNHLLIFIKENRVVQLVDLKNQYHSDSRQVHINAVNSYGNYIYVSCNNALILVSKDMGSTWSYIELDSNQPVTSCYQINNSIYAEIQNQGLFPIINRINNKVLDWPDSNFFQHVHIIKNTSQGTIGLSKSKNLFFNNTTHKLEELQFKLTENVSDLEVINETLFFSTDFGIYRVNLTNHFMVDIKLPYELANKSTRFVKHSKYGTWVTTYTGSLFQSKDTTRFYKDIVYAAAPVNDSIWAMGTEGQGIKWFNVKNPQWSNATLINKLINPYVYAVYSHHNNLFIGTHNGLFIYNSYSKQTELVPNTQHLLIKKISTFNNNIYVSASNGLHIFKANKLIKFTDYNKLVNSHLIDNKFIILATQTSGLIIYDSNSQKLLKKININNKLYSNVIYDIAHINNNYFLFTHNGLEVLNHNFDSVIVNESSYNNIEFNHNALDFYNNYIYAGHTNGLVKIDPMLLNQNKTKFNSPMLSAYKRIDKNDSYEVLLNKAQTIYELALPSQTLAINLEFAPGLFNNATPLFYYNLPLFNNNWESFSSSHGLIISSLKPGMNELKVKSHKFSKNHNTIFIYKKPYFYQQYWFIIVVTLLVLAAIYLIIWYNNYINKLNIQTKAKIARDLHDEVGGLLSTISLQTQFLSYNSDKNLEKKYLKNIQISSKKAVEALGSIVWSVNNNNNSWQDLIFKLMEHAKDFFETSNVTLSIENNISVGSKKINNHLQHNILMIFKELCTNIYKHAQATHVQLSFYRRSSKLIIELQDNGVGFDPYLDYGDSNGLRNIRLRAKEHHIKVAFVNKNGTVVKLEIDL
jgi:ligand-binding sensor domain-containing protein/two-component sensor histidine kinase